MSLSPPLLGLGLVLSFALPAVGYHRQRTATSVDWPRIRRSLLRNWAALGAVVALVLVAGEPRDLWLRIPSVGVLVDGLLYGFIAFAGTMLLVALAYRFAGDGIPADDVSLFVFDQPPARRIAVAVTGAVVETTLFHGFVLAALLSLGAGPWVAGGVAATGLLLTRAQRGRSNAVQWVPGAIVLSALAVWSRTVLVVVLVRLVYDAITLLSGDPDDYDTGRDG
ncbi:hypothetical protein [Halostella salina]|uniref:hypothetical protein n=1 Tax=Halostella salina TaxID=1547897 RepID=UPI000EF7D129|nr:hypothetical protein [Halostella salina]